MYLHTLLFSTFGFFTAFNVHIAVYQQSYGHIHIRDVITVYPFKMSKSQKSFNLPFSSSSFIVITLILDLSVQHCIISFRCHHRNFTSAEFTYPWRLCTVHTDRICDLDSSFLSQPTCYQSLLFDYIMFDY